MLYNGHVYPSVCPIRPQIPIQELQIIIFYLFVGLEWNQIHYYWVIYWPIVPALDDRW
jgi:hypothetical protein